MVFGEWFPLIKSKEADFAGGLANNLGHNAAKSNKTRTEILDQASDPTIMRHILINIKIKNKAKVGRFFVAAAAPYRGKTSHLHQTMGSSNVGLTGPSYRKIFQNSVSAESLPNLSHIYNNYTSVRTNFKSRSIKTSTNGCNISDGLFQGRVLQPVLKANGQPKRKCYT